VRSVNSDWKQEYAGNEVALNLAAVIVSPGRAEKTSLCNSVEQKPDSPKPAPVGSNVPATCNSPVPQPKSTELAGIGLYLDLLNQKKNESEAAYSAWLAAPSESNTRHYQNCKRASSAAEEQFAGAMRGPPSSNEGEFTTPAADKQHSTPARSIVPTNLLGSGF